jgi:hypothetical protein
VLGLCADTVTGVHTARTVDDVRTLEPRVHGGFATLAAVRGEGGDPGDPFGGLCTADPAHGAALPPGPTADGARAPALCRDCRQRADAGDTPPVRMVPMGRAVVPYTAVTAVRGTVAGVRNEPHSDR